MAFNGAHDYGVTVSTASRPIHTCDGSDKSEQCDWSDQHIRCSHLHATWAMATTYFCFPCYCLSLGMWFHGSLGFDIAQYPGAMAGYDVMGFRLLLPRSEQQRDGSNKNWSRPISLVTWRERCWVAGVTEIASLLSLLVSPVTSVNGPSKSKFSQEAQ